ncbi:MAG: ABC transporter permease [Ruminococcus sp.]|nr:ABC transporter permease [Ruminococcus sp.]
MKSKFKFLIKHSLEKKIKTKWFKIVNIFLCLLLIFLVNMDYVIELFGGDFNSKDKIYIVDNLNKFESFKSYFNSISENLDMGDYELVLDNEAINKKDELDEEIIIVINKDEDSYINGEIISFDTVTKSTYEIILNTFNALKSEMVLEISGLSPDEIAKITSPAKVTETVLDVDAKDNQTKENLSAIITTVVIVPFFILIVTMVQMLGAEINDEKTSRGMEIIISSVPAKTHFLAKVIAALSYVLIQGCLLFLYAFLAAFLRNMLVSTEVSGMGSIIGELIKTFNDAGTFSLLLKGAIPLVILYVVSFIAYAILSATLASMTTNNEDFQQLQTPLMIIMLVGYYIALMAVMFDGSIFINIISYIPLLSVLIAPTLYLIGEISLISLIGTTLVTTIATYFLYIYGLRIYKVGILNYSSNKLWKKIFKSLKNK